MYFVFGLQTVKKVTSDADLFIRMECLWYYLCSVYISYFGWNKTLTWNLHTYLLFVTSVFHIFLTKIFTFKTFFLNHLTSWCWIHVNDIELKRDIANCHRVGVKWQWFNIKSSASLSTLFVQRELTVKMLWMSSNLYEISNIILYESSHFDITSRHRLTR